MIPLLYRARRAGRNALLGMDKSLALSSGLCSCQISLFQAFHNAIVTQSFMIVARVLQIPVCVFAHFGKKYAWLVDTRFYAMLEFSSADRKCRIGKHG